MTTDLMAPRRSTAAPAAPPRRADAVSLHQVVTTQAAVALVLVGAVTGGPALFAAVLCAALALTLTWLRVRDRWAFAWLTAALRLNVRRRAAARLSVPRHTTAQETTARETAAQGSAAQIRMAGAILELTAPGTRVTSTDLPSGPAALLTDPTGLTMLLDLGDPTALLAETRPDLPAPWELLPADGRDRPAGRIQLLLTGAPAPTAGSGTGPVAGSYQLLTEGRVLGQARAVLAVHVSRAAGWSDGELLHSLTGQVRKLARRLTAQPLAGPEAVRLFFDLSYADPAAPVHEDWTRLRTGPLSQVTFHAHAPGGAGLTAELMARLLLLPATATTVTLTADVPAHDRPPHSRPVTLAVRLTVPDPATLEAAATALRQLTARERVRLHRRDGDHLPGLATTLPLAVTDPEPPARGQRLRRQRPPASEAFGRLAVPTGWSGLAVGRSRQGDPVLVRLFRPEHTRILLVGGAHCARLTAFRAMAIGARVLVRTHRPQDWATFAHSGSVPDGAIAVVPLDHPAEAPPGSPLHPVLTVLDPGPSRHPATAAPGVTRVGSHESREDGLDALAFATDWTAAGAGGPPHDLDRPEWEATGPVPGSGGGPGSGLARRPGHRLQGGPWTATLTVRPTVGSEDVTALRDADLLLVQPLREAEAELIGGALDLGDTTGLLSRMRPGMLAVLSPPAVRWAMLTPTPVERVLIGNLDRPANER
ncbi:type VII secretion protein EccE [Actinoplanes ianthinogenes]|uniref:type VII secretion protein EccE n=1 Tax=Actinoplanes ianthinogenes TaxID=122358 RepID=UPI001670ADAB|nr:type VII secretion protein EccE [Actinoplanes ianthinogenes]